MSSIVSLSVWRDRARKLQPNDFLSTCCRLCGISPKMKTTTIQLKRMNAYCLCMYSYTTTYCQRGISSKSFFFFLSLFLVILLFLSSFWKLPTGENRKKSSDEYLWPEVGYIIAIANTHINTNFTLEYFYLVLHFSLKKSQLFLTTKQEEKKKTERKNVNFYSWKQMQQKTSAEETKASQILGIYYSDCESGYHDMMCCRLPCK